MAGLVPAKPEHDGSMCEGDVIHKSVILGLVPRIHVFSSVTRT
jgi:hypothetical protein